MLEKEQIIGLLNIPGIGKKTVLSIIKKNNIKEKISDNDLFELLIKNSNKNISKILFIECIDKAKKNIVAYADTKIYTIEDPNFPILLKEIDNPPLVLYTKGNIDILNSYPTAAVIGTREPTPHGERIGIRIGELLAENHITVVSGLASGCDSAGHRGCLKKKGNTVAFLAHGLNYIYPKENQRLAEEILDLGGCLVSEYPNETLASKYYFVERDRLQSGSSIAIIVIETDIKGGTMHTVQFSEKQRRILYCYKHPDEEHTNKSAGNKMLIESNRALPIEPKPDSIIQIIKTIQEKYYKLKPQEGKEKYNIENVKNLEPQQINFEDN